MARLSDLSGVSDATARRLLDAYLPLVRRVASRMYRALPEHEVVAVGTDAILEAYLTQDEARSSEATWVRRVVHWRLAEAVRRLPWERNAESLDADPQVLNGKNPEEAYQRASAFAALARLPPNHQMVIDGRLRGESYVEVGHSIGISPQRAHRVAKRALEVLASEQEVCTEPKKNSCT